MIIDPYRWHTVHVTRVLHESPDAVIIQTERPTDYAFEPGQHAIIRVTLQDGSQRLRQYSFAGSPSAQDLRFVITRSPQGEVSSWFVDTCATSSVIEISQPFAGPLQINAIPYSNVGMVAGGSGIAPMLAYLHMFREATSAPLRTLLYATRISSYCARDSLRAAQGEIITVRMSDVEGRLTADEIIDALKACDLILLCGSRQFVTELRALCNSKLPDAEIRAEAFSLV